MGLSIVVCASLFLAGCSAPAPAPPPAAATAPAQSTNPSERGQYLVTVMACNDCHTPFKMGAAGPEPDMTRRSIPAIANEVPPYQPPSAAGN